MKKRLRKKKITVYKKSILEYTLLISIYGLFLNKVVNDLLNGQLNTSDIFSLGFGILAFFIFLICCARQSISANFKNGTLTFSNLGLKKITIPLNEVAAIAIVYENNKHLFPKIITKCGNVYELDWWDNIGIEGYVHDYEINATRNRYERFVDKFNEILEEKY